MKNIMKKVALGLLLAAGLIVVVLVWRTPDVQAPDGNLEINSSVEQTQNVTLVIQFPDGEKSYNMAVPAGATVEDVLQKASQENDLHVEMVDYGESMGVFVDSIGDLGGNAEQNLYWHLYINGELSPVGASFAPVEEGDVVLWRYEEMQEIE